ncbi:MAG: hypothetical protein ABSB53_05190, partial [Nitrososphaerales archaeon]
LSLDDMPGLGGPDSWHCTHQRSPALGAALADLQDGSVDFYTVRRGPYRIAADLAGEAHDLYDLLSS